MSESENAAEKTTARPKRRRKIKRWLFLGGLVLALVWLNGPGLRFIAPKVASHFMSKAGLRGSFKVGGSLTGGISISDFVIKSDNSLANLTIGKITPDYSLSGLFKGKLISLTVDGVHADLRLGVKTKAEETKDTPPFDLNETVKSLRSLRSQILPLNLDLKDVSISATRDGKTEFVLEKSRITHAPASSELHLVMGAITDANGRKWSAQNSTIVWNDESLTLDRLDPLPAVSLQDLVLNMPRDGEPSLDANLAIDNSRFVISSTPGFSSVTLELREGNLQLGDAAKHFGISIPAKANLIALAIELEGILPDPKQATGNVRISLDDIAWKDWSVPELSLDARLESGQASVVSRGLVFGTAVSIESSVPVTRDGKKMTLGNAEGKFNIASLPAALRGLASRLPQIDPESPIPASSVDGNFSVSFDANKPNSASADVVLQPQDPELATTVRLKGQWMPQGPITAELTMDGVKSNITYQTETSTYHGAVEFDQFTSKRIERWLAIARVKLDGVASVSGKWNGSGELKTAKHQGDLMLSQANWMREKAPPISGSGGLKYQWPGGFETEGIQVQVYEQTISLKARMADGLLEMRDLLWSDGKQELAGGNASLSAPEDFSKWKEMLANDTRPISVAIQSRKLSLALLKPWVPALEKLDANSTGQLTVNISGTYRDPLISVKLEASNLRSPSQPSLPPANLTIELDAKDKQISLTGNATAPDFAPELLKAGMPFRLQDWINDPKLLQDEPIEARVDFPRLDLSRFSSLVTTADKVSGIVTGNVSVSGTVSHPELKGFIDLAGAGIRFKSDKLPAVEGGGMNVEMDLDRVLVKNLKATISGGTLQGDGSLDIAKGKLGEINFRLLGKQLPLVRNDFLILRSNLDLRLQGPWETATLSGTVGAVDGIFYRDIELLPIGAPFTGPSAAALPKIDASKTTTSTIPAPFGNWGLALNVRTDAPFLIRGNLATGEITGSMKIGGKMSNPAPDGAFIIKNFKASLPFSTLEVRQGTVSFKPESGFDPILEIRGTAEPRPYVVTLYAYGRASNPQLVLTSNPPLPENEIMTLLATGTTTSNLENPQAASSRAMQLFAEELRRGRFRIGKQLRPLLALLDRVDFTVAESDPYSSSSFSTATIELTDKWYFSAGVGESGDSRFLAIWRLSFR